MKIAFFTETGSTSNHFIRTSTNIRTDTAWKIALDAIDFHLYSEPSEKYDLGIFIIPKKCEDGNFDISIWINHFRERIAPKLRRVAVMQEGPSHYWQDYRIKTQISFLTFFSLCDMILCHNEYDRKYYEGLLQRPAHILSPLMIEESIPKDIVKPEHRAGVMVGGNWCSWYSGQDSYFIAEEFGEPIYAPSMGRKREDEELIQDIIYSPYRNWSMWMIDLSTRKYAVHLMRTFAAGTFALNCAYLGIPCIGYNQLDTQRTLFPELSVEVGDLASARKEAKHLKSNIEFYNYCSVFAKKSYSDNYKENVFLKRFEDIMNNV